MKNFFQRYKILFLFISIISSFFICGVVFSVDENSECSIYMYDNGSSYCVSFGKTDTVVQFIKEGENFSKGSCLSQTMAGCGEEAIDSGQRLKNSNCLANIESCFDLFREQGVVTWEGPETKEIIQGNSEGIYIKVLSSTENISKIVCSGIVSGMTCSEGKKDGVTINFSHTLDVGIYKIKAVAITDKNHTSVKEVTLTVNQVDCVSFNNLQCKDNVNCFFNNYNGDNKCHNKQDNSICNTLGKEVCGTATGSQVCQWSDTKNQCITSLASSIEDRYKKPDGYTGPLPDCAFDGSCKDVNDLLELAIKVGEMLFGVIGSLAFVFFIYGGFTMIMSFGSAEKFKKGQQILIAAVIGMVIAFGAYALVGFLLSSLGVNSDLIFIK